MLGHENVPPGSVLYFVNDDDGFLSDEPHYFVVANMEVNEVTAILVLPCATSQRTPEHYVKRHKLAPETLVYVTPEESGGILKEPSIFNCNTVFERTFMQLEAQGKRLKFRWIMPPSVMERIRCWIMASIEVYEYHKELVSAC